MAYDTELADRIRNLIIDDSDLSEKKMFGGLAFLVGGNMAVGVSSQGGIMIRVEKDQTDSLIATTAAQPFEMKGRAAKGWLRVHSEDLSSEEALSSWVNIGTDYARSLPAKR